MLLSNLQEYGATLTHHLHSGNFRCVTNKKDIVAVFCLTRSGLLLFQTDRKANYNNLILKSALKESIPLKGFMGDWNLVTSLWKSYKKQNPSFQVNFSPKEILYKRDLKHAPNLPRDHSVIFLNSQHFTQWYRAYKNYFAELGIAFYGTKKEFHQKFLHEIKKQNWWGYFQEKCLCSMASRRANFDNMAQIGGVYTLPEYRRKGYAKTCMIQIMNDSKTIHRDRDLVLFTPENNKSARKLYEKLGFKKIGYFGVVIGQD